MIVEGFVWPSWVVEKIELKHRVSKDEVEEIFDNYPRKRRKVGEGKHLLYGRTDVGRCILVVFAYQPQNRRARIISARDMTDSERRYFGRK